MDKLAAARKVGCLEDQLEVEIEVEVDNEVVLEG
jgi:hypothetical protein